MSNIKPGSFASILNSTSPSPPPGTAPETQSSLSSPPPNLPPYNMSHSASVPPFIKQQQELQTMNSFTGATTAAAASPPHKHSPTSKSKKILLSTSSPEGIQVASKVTPTRLANLLIRKGPLPIRHITSQLALEVPSFDLLSLSKQRRLIMAAMEQPDLINNVVFEKIGWGQWAVRKIDSDYIVTEGTEGTTYQPDSTERKMINVNDLRNQPNLKLGWSKNKKKRSAKLGDPRRESITQGTRNLHDLKIPNEALDSNAIESDSEDEYALSDHIDEDSSSEEEEEQEEVFTFDEEPNPKFKPSPPIKFAKRVPIKFSPPPDSSGNRRKSSSSQPSNTTTSAAAISKPSHRHQIFPRSRLSSLENLDNYIVSSAKNSTVSINSPPMGNAPAPAISFSYSGTNSVLSASPANSWTTTTGPSPNGGQNYIHHHSMDTISPERANGGTNRRKSSFNESHVRSTLSTVKQSHHNTPIQSSKLAQDNVSDTDEEDWAAIGPQSLLEKHKQSNIEDEVNEEDKSAAFALVHLMSV
ncbi:Protein STB3 [Spathaspora sp. JA1]|nr:Protein STB3 [Spathaspora sp. JA1]